MGLGNVIGGTGSQCTYPPEALLIPFKGKKVDSQNSKGLVKPLSTNTIRAIMTVVDSKGVNSVSIWTKKLRGPEVPDFHQHNFMLLLEELLMYWVRQIESQLYPKQRNSFW